MLEFNQKGHFKANSLEKEMYEKGKNSHFRRELVNVAIWSNSYESIWMLVASVLDIQML